MANLLIIIGALLVALRMMGPFLRIVISLLAKLVAFVFLIAVVIVLLVAVFSHGMFI
jgi:hypothetical protein